MGARQFGAGVGIALCLAVVVSVAAGTPLGHAGKTPTVSRETPTVSRETPTESPTLVAGRDQPQQFEFDAIVLDVRVFENGTADWRVVQRTRLDDAETATAFERYEADVQNDSTHYRRQFADETNTTIQNAERATGREMALRNVSVRADIREFPQRYGVVVYSFRWTGFAATSDDRLRVGESLSNFVLDEKTRLLVSWPEGYETTTIRPPPDETRPQSAVWVGPTEFAGDEPRIVVSRPTPALDVPWRPLVIALVVVGVTMVGGWLVYRTRETDDSESELPEELLSNEERVLRLLERRGGRVKQKAIVDELDWTEAKTSQVVGNLREQGEIESFRLGRENVLALPEDERDSPRDSSE